MNEQLRFINWLRSVLRLQSDDDEWVEEQIRDSGAMNALYKTTSWYKAWEADGFPNAATQPEQEGSSAFHDWWTSGTSGDDRLFDFWNINHAFEEYKALGGTNGYTGFAWAVYRGRDPFREEGLIPSEESQKIMIEAPKLFPALGATRTVGDYEALPTENDTLRELFQIVDGLEEAMAKAQKSGDFSEVQKLLDSYTSKTSVEGFGDPVSYEVVDEKGAILLVYKDANGNPIPAAIQPLGFVQTELTPYQKAQIADWAATNGMNQAQLDFQISKWADEYKLSQSEFALARQQFYATFGLSQEKFEFEKQQFAQSIGLEQEKFEWQKVYQQEQLDIQREQLEEQRAATYAQLAAQPANWIQAYLYGSGGELPPAPAWLQDYVPDIGEGAIAPAPMRTPSAYNWQRMPSGQREMLGGYARFAQVPGSPQSMQEITERVGWTLPDNYEKQSRWQPVKQ